MCAVRSYSKHMGSMDSSYPVHVQRRRARERLIHLIHRIFRCCGGRLRRGGVKSAGQTHELSRNRGVGPSPWGRNISTSALFSPYRCVTNSARGSEREQERERDDLILPTSGSRRRGHVPSRTTWVVEPLFSTLLRSKSSSVCIGRATPIQNEATPGTGREEGAGAEVRGRGRGLGGRRGSGNVSMRSSAAVDGAGVDAGSGAGAGGRE